MKENKSMLLLCVYLRVNICQLVMYDLHIKYPC